MVFSLLNIAKVTVGAVTSTALFPIIGAAAVIPAAVSVGVVGTRLNDVMSDETSGNNSTAEALILSSLILGGVALIVTLKRKL